MTMRRGLGTLLAAVLASTVGAVDLPRKSPALAIGLNGGKTLPVDSLKGKAVLLAFILTTCPHCQHTTGILKQLQAEYGPRGLQVVEAAIDQGAEPLVPGFVQHFSPNFPVGFVTYDVAAEYLQHSPMLILHVPALVFIDRQGTIRAEYEGDDRFFSEEVQEKNLRDQIEKLLRAGDMTRKTQAGKTAAKN
jgi:cytochrome oxidase Cu insertion factor (SCO1/SenC/PrrC family)